MLLKLERILQNRISEQKLRKKIHKDLLTNALEIECTTPYTGILIELGEWPIVQKIHYKKLMLYHHLMHSDEGRLARQVLIGQIRSYLPGNWSHEIKTILKKYKIDAKQVIEMKKSQWKRNVKRNIESWIKDLFEKSIE